MRRVGAELVQIAASVGGLLLVVVALVIPMGHTLRAMAHAVRVPDPSTGARVLYATAPTRVRDAPTTAGKVRFTLIPGDIVWVSKPRADGWAVLYDPIVVPGEMPALGWVQANLLSAKPQPVTGRVARWLREVDVPSGLHEDSDFRFDVKCPGDGDTCTATTPSTTPGGLCRGYTVWFAHLRAVNTRRRITVRTTCGRHRVIARYHPWRGGYVEHEYLNRIVYRNGL